MAEKLFELEAVDNVPLRHVGLYWEILDSFLKGSLDRVKVKIKGVEIKPINLRNGIKNWLGKKEFKDRSKGAGLLYVNVAMVNKAVYLIKVRTAKVKK